jgi:hypothetical protein
MQRQLPETSADQELYRTLDALINQRQGWLTFGRARYK